MSNKDIKINGLTHRGGQIDIVDCGAYLRCYRHENKTLATRSGRLWSLMNERCKEGSAEQTKHQTYVGCINGFADFQHFAEWCQIQIGYMNKNTKGQFWQLDKDILVKGNKIYSPDRCVFIPPELNKLLTKRSNDRGEYPIGVTRDCNSYRAQMERKLLGKSRLSKFFKTPEECFMFYKEQKEKYIKDVAKMYEGLVDQRVIVALNKYEVSIGD